MEALLLELLPRLLNGRSTFTLHAHQGKSDLLNKLSARLKAYARWLPETSRIIVVVDRDDDDCCELKQRLSGCAADAGLTNRMAAGQGVWRVSNRIAIEELEAWFFGEWPAVRKAYPRVPLTVPNQAAYRQCDAITGGTWEAFERILGRAGYFATGLGKIEAARQVGKHFDHNACRSPSFRALRDAILDCLAE